jgi:hypothetical protein
VAHGENNSVDNSASASAAVRIALFDIDDGALRVSRAR